MRDPQSLSPCTSTIHGPDFHIAYVCQCSGLRDSLSRTYIFNTVPVPSGWNNEDCLELVRKKYWFSSQITKANPPKSESECPDAYHFSEFYTYKMLRLRPCRPPEARRIWKHRL